MTALPAWRGLGTRVLWRGRGQSAYQARSALPEMVAGRPARHGRRGALGVRVRLARLDHLRSERRRSGRSPGGAFSHLRRAREEHSGAHICAAPRKARTFLWPSCATTSAASPTRTPESSRSRSTPGKRQKPSRSRTPSPRDCDSTCPRSRTPRPPVSCRPLSPVSKSSILPGRRLAYDRAPPCCSNSAPSQGCSRASRSPSWPRPVRRGSTPRRISRPAACRCSGP